MSTLDKYKVATEAPKISHRRAKAPPIEAIKKTFIAGVDKQKAKAQAWKPGAKDLRSWVTRDEQRDLAWVTVKYGARPVAVRRTKQSTIGPVKLGDVPKVFDDIKKAALSGELDKALLKVSSLGPRKKKTAAKAKS